MGRVEIIDPLGFLDMVCLESKPAVIATGSGGVQKDAFFHGVTCVTLRDETEWVELVEAGWNRIVLPNSSEKVCKAILAARNTVGTKFSHMGMGMRRTAL